MLPIVHPSSAKTKGNSRKNKSHCQEQPPAIHIGWTRKTFVRVWIDSRV